MSNQYKTFPDKVMASVALSEKIKQQGDLVRKLKAEKAPKDQVGNFQDKLFWKNDNFYQAFKFGSLDTEEELKVLDNYFLDQSYVENFKFSGYDLCLLKHFQAKSVNFENRTNLLRWWKHIECLSKDKNLAKQKESTIENVLEHFSKNIKVQNKSVTNVQNVSCFAPPFVVKVFIGF